MVPDVHFPAHELLLEDVPSHVLEGVSRRRGKAEHEHMNNLKTFFMQEILRNVSATSPITKPHRASIIIYAPMIYTAPCVRFLMRADRLRYVGKWGGGGGAGNLEFCGPL